MQLPSKEVRNTIVQIPDEFKDLFKLQNNMEGVVPRLPQIGIIHAGQMFRMPDERKVESFEGIIIDQHRANAWWEKPAGDGIAVIPDCFSMNGVVPDKSSGKLQNETCAGCPQNEYGSDPKTGKGKACKNMARLHVIMEGSALPKRLTVPPSSLKPFDVYMTALYDSGIPYACVVTEFNLTRKVAGTNEYSEMKFSRKSVLSTSELRTVGNFIQQFKDTARKQEIRSDEYVTETKEAEKVQDNDIPF